MGKKVKELQTINVNTSFKNMEADISHKDANKIGNRTFAYIGLKESIKV